MKVLSIQLGHNATVAFSDMGSIVGVLSQEKCDNLKNSPAFPEDAIKTLLYEIKWKISDIDRILISGLFVYPPKAYEYSYDSKNRIQDKSFVIRFVKKFRDSILGKVMPWFFDMLREIRAQSLVRQGKNYLRVELDKMGFVGTPIEHIEHHLCHARGAYHSFLPDSEVAQPALIFTLDGMGDSSCATVTKVEQQGKWKNIAVTPIHSSLGSIYSSTTRFLGMKILEHEYKVMGLAPYAKEKYMLDTYERIFKPVIWLNEKNPLVFESRVNTSRFYDYLTEHAIGERFDNMAAALQHLTEELVTQWIRNAIHQTGIRRIFTGGGVFMNVKLNRRIQEMCEVEQAFFMPSCGDESNPIGACYDHSVRNGFQTKPLENLYLGISYSNRQIEQFIEKKGLRDQYQVAYHYDIEDKISELLANREIVARFSGRCEWGARSLGNRAILAHPSYMESFYTVNDYIKSRDFWMPFAPSMLDTAAPQYLKGYNPKKVKASHMITAFTATELGIKQLRAALHQGDYTLRPQVIEEYVNPKYYRLISLFEKRTGVGAVLNTSFNMHGYPLVATLEQAIMTLENSGLIHLALENYLISKKTE